MMPAGIRYRINNSDGYKPGNCRWVLPKQNMSNRSVSKKYIINSIEFFSLFDAAKYFGVSEATVRAWCVGRKTNDWLVKANKAVERYYPPKENCFVKNLY